jgi:hypothetical protein
MLDTNDQMSSDLQPLMEWDDWIKDLKKVVDDSSYHSDEIFESDDENGNAFFIAYRLLMFYR